MPLTFRPPANSGGGGGDGSTTPGPAGKSAYQSWLDSGNSGTEADFVGWLKGPKGDQGVSIKGDKGDQGDSIKGDKGDQGNSVKGDAGKSAYQSWLEQSGNSGKTEAQFLASLVGAKGADAPTPHPRARQVVVLAAGEDAATVSPALPSDAVLLTRPAG